MASALKRRDTDMTSGSIVRHLISFAIPLLIGNIFQQLYNTVDSVVVGNYVGKEALAAVGSVGPIVNMLIGFFSGLASGGGVVISQYYGAHDNDKVHRAVHTTMAMTLVLCVIMSVVGVLMTPLMLRMMDTPDDVFGEASLYLQIYFAGLTGLLIYNIGSGILRAVGDSRRPLYFLIVSAITNTVLDLVFVAVLGWGVAGVAIATIIAQGVSALFVLITLTRSEGPYRIFWSKVRFHWDILKRICSIGLPTAIQMAITSFSNVFVQSYINRFGSSCMAGWTIFNKIDAFMLLPVTSLSLAVSTFAGQNLGAGNVKRVRQGTNSSLLLMTISTTVLLIPLMIFAPELIGLFNREPEVLRYGTLFLRLVSPFYLVCMSNNATIGTLRGAGDTKAPMIINLASYVAFRQLYLFVADRLSGSVVVIALGYPVGWMLCTLLSSIYYYRTDWMGRLQKKFQKTA